MTIFPDSVIFILSLISDEIIERWIFIKKKKKQTTNDYVIPKDLSVDAIGMLNSLLVRSNDELENIDLYSLGNDSRKDVALAFRELRKKKYIIYNALDDTYYIYVSPQK